MTQRGSTLLEALVAILIFSIGILAIVGLQAASIRASADARYRTAAGQLADQLVGEMWAGDRTISVLQTNFAGTDGSGGANYLAFVTRVEATLPVPTGATFKPDVTITSQGRVSIMIYWRAPGEDVTVTHRYVVDAYVI